MGLLLTYWSTGKQLYRPLCEKKNCCCM